MELLWDVCNICNGYSPIRKTEARLAALPVEPRHKSGSVGAAVLHVGGESGVFISARRAQTMDSDELSAEIAAIEASRRRSAESRRGGPPLERCAASGASALLRFAMHGSVEKELNN